MSVVGTFYEAQARVCADAAAATELPMLREKFQRAEAAWQELATRETRILAARLRREGDKRDALADAGEDGVLPE